MSQLAPELILLRTLLEVIVKSFKVSQTGMRKKIRLCFGVFAIDGCQKRLDIHLKVTPAALGLILTASCLVI